MKKRVLTLISLMLVIAVSAVALVACATGPLTMDDIIKEDGSIDASKIVGSEVTAEQWDAATNASVLDKDLTYYSATQMANSKKKIVVDGKKVMIEESAEITSNGELVETVTTEYQEKLDGNKCKNYTFDDEKWSAVEDDYNANDILGNFDFIQYNGKIADFTYNAEAKEYTQENSMGIATMKFTDGKVSYLSLKVMGAIFIEIAVSYEDATVTLPTIG